MFKFLLTRYLKKREDEVWSVYEMFGGPVSTRGAWPESGIAAKV